MAKQRSSLKNTRGGVKDANAKFKRTFNGSEKKSGKSGHSLNPGE